MAGDFFVSPLNTVFDLEASLRGVAVAELGAAVERFFDQAPVDLLSITAADFRAALEAAVSSR